MRRTKDILRLGFESGLGLRQIARSLAISVGTVHDYLQRAEAAGIKWPLPEGLDDSHLEGALFRQPTAAVSPRKAPPDYAATRECERGSAANLDGESYTGAGLSRLHVSLDVVTVTGRLRSIGSNSQRALYLQYKPGDFREVLRAESPGPRESARRHRAFRRHSRPP